MATDAQIEAAARAMYYAAGHGEPCSPECTDHWQHVTGLRTWFIDCARTALATVEASTPGLTRTRAAQTLRWLAEGRKQYCHRCPQSQTDMHEMSPMELAVHEEHAAASWLADIIEGTNTGKGWLHSMQWAEWHEIAATLDGGTCGHQLVPYEDSAPCIVAAGTPHARHIDSAGGYWANEAR